MPVWNGAAFPNFAELPWVGGRSTLSHAIAEWLATDFACLPRSSRFVGSHQTMFPTSRHSDSAPLSAVHARAVIAFRDRHKAYASPVVLPAAAQKMLWRRGKVGRIGDRCAGPPATDL